MAMHAQKQKKINPAGRQPSPANDSFRSPHPFDTSLTGTDDTQFTDTLPGFEIDSPVAPRIGHHFADVRVHAAVPETIQTKLTINQPGDVYEQEAERVAEQVMQVEAPASSQNPPTPHDARLGAGDLLTRKEVSDTSVHETASTSPLVDEVLSSGGGQPLDESTRSFMEPRFGHDFSRVRVHTDKRAVESARSVNALAYTVGQDVVFGGGQYEPGTNEGKKLLAHELMHVVQQSRLQNFHLQRVPIAVEKTTSKSDEGVEKKSEGKPQDTGTMPATFAQLTKEQPEIADQVQMLSQNYRIFIRGVDPTLDRAGIYNRATYENVTQRRSREQVFSYEGEIRNQNLYESKHLSIWLEYVIQALGSLGPLLSDLKEDVGEGARSGAYWETQRQELLSAAHQLSATDFMKRGVDTRKQEGQTAVEPERIREAVEYIRTYLREHWKKDLSQPEMSVHGTVIAIQLVQRLHLDAPQIRKVLDTLGGQSVELQEAALFGGETVKALLDLKIGGLQQYRVEGEGFFSSVVRAEREGRLEYTPDARHFTAYEIVKAVGGFLAGAVRGIWDSVVSNVKGIVDLFTPQFWKTITKTLTEDIPEFITNEKTRFQIGQMMGKADVKEEQRLATAEPYEYGRILGHMFGTALVEIFLLFVGIGWVLDIVKGSTILMRVLHPLFELGQEIAKARIVAKGLHVAEAVAESINVLNRRFQKLLDRLPVFTDAGQLRRSYNRLKGAEDDLRREAERVRGLQEAVRAASDAEAVQKQIPELSKAIDDYERKLAVYEREVGGTPEVSGGADIGTEKPTATATGHEAKEDTEKTTQAVEGEVPPVEREIPAAKGKLTGEQEAAPQTGLTLNEKIIESQVQAAKDYYPGHKGAVGSLMVEGKQPMLLKSGEEGGPWGGTQRGGIPRGEGYGFTSGGPSQGNIATHVEGHAAAIMTQQNIKKAVLIVDRIECNICGRDLPSALPPGSELTVVSPGESPTIYRSSHAE